jgi:rhamnogalacturonyl hydrolase YesR
MYCSFGNAVRITPDAGYDSILINSARSLSTRFNPKVGCIRSWNSEPSHFLVIIDNMMNLELLMYAFEKTHDSSFYHIAVTHANITMKNHFRPDYSSYHVVDYNPATGAVQRKITNQGAADESAWARGQAWGLYGYTMMYRTTGDKKYLEQAKHIADFILHHPNLPSDKIPFWDFNAPGIPNAYRDASAAAIISSALIELAGYTSGNEKNEYKNVAATILKNLSSPPYKSKGDEVGGFLLKHSVGNLPAKSEIDVPLSYADYYFVEASMRYLGKLPVEKRNTNK